MNHKNNRRSASTKARIRSSLLTLLKEEPLHRITVRGLCEHAVINRSTFYNHYSSPGEILDEIKEDFITSITEVLASAKEHFDTKEKRERIEYYLVDILLFLEKEKELCFILKNSDVSPTVNNLILNNPVIQEYFKEALSDNYSEKELPYVYHYLLFGAFRVIDQWFLDGCTMTAAELAGFLASLISRF